MRDLKVWIRVGDQDDYHDFDSVDDAAKAIHEYLHWPGFGDDGPCVGQCGRRVERYYGPGLRGIVINGTPYQGNNGISLFWGDDDAEFEAELTDRELEGFTAVLGR